MIPSLAPKCWAFHSSIYFVVSHWEKNFNEEFHLKEDILSSTRKVKGASCINFPTQQVRMKKKLIEFSSVSQKNDHFPLHN